MSVKQIIGAIAWFILACGTIVITIFHCGYFCKRYNRQLPTTVSGHVPLPDDANFPDLVLFACGGY